MLRSQPSDAAPKGASLCEQVRTGQVSSDDHQKSLAGIPGVTSVAWGTVSSNVSWVMMTLGPQPVNIQTNTSENITFPQHS